MDPISFGLGLVGEVRHQVNSVKTRIANFQDGQKTFSSLSSKLELLLQHMSVVDRLLNAVPSPAPAATTADFNRILADVVESIKKENWTLPQSLSTPFAGSGSSAMGNVNLKFRQFTRAKTLHAAMNSLEVKIEKASTKLLHLSSVLANALSSKEVQTTVVSKMEENQSMLLSKLDNLRIAEASGEMYRPATSTPAPNTTVRLDFCAKDEHGRLTTSEGLLKQSVLCSTSTELITAAVGAMKHAYGVLGMAGVGKTVALQGLGHDEDILNRFSDGVHYMTFGRGATLQTAIREIAKIMTITGASTQVDSVKAATSLKEAVDYAVPWFEGKICLYLLDDLWPAEHLPTGYLLDLRQLLRGSPGSRMAISTRNFRIASDAGCVIHFEPRDVFSLESFRIFMAYATRYSPEPSSSYNSQRRSTSVSKILSICAGLPIALAVTGCTVAKYTQRYGSFEKACEVYSKKLQDKQIWLGEESTPEGISLNAAILVSLDFLQVEFEKRKLCEHSISDLYTGLCVFENQAWVPVSVLQRLWQLDDDEVMDFVDLFCEMSLATRQFRCPLNRPIEELGIVLHDLQLDFCQRRAMEARSSTLWHSRLLTGYLANETATEFPNAPTSQSILSFTPRRWWSRAVPDDGYIHRNLCRHLICSGYHIEFAALLLQGRWTQLRKKIGGILALKTDFDLLQSAIKRDPHIADVWRSFEHIFKAVRLSWGRMEKGLRVFQFHVCGRLAKLRKECAVVDAYLKSIEKCTPVPYLLPVSSFFPDVDSSLIMEIPLGRECTCITCSPCGRYIAGGAGSHVVIASTSNGEIIQRTMLGHRSRVSCIEFCRGSTEIVFGQRNGTVMVWEWRKPEDPVRVFEGHSSDVTGVARSSDGRRIFSSSKDSTLRIWDMTTALQEYELPQKSVVNCVAVGGEGEMIAIGLDDGTLQVVDSSLKHVFLEKSWPFIASSVQFSPNGSYIAAGSKDNCIRVWNTQTWTRVCESLIGHEDWVTSVSFSPDGKQITSSSRDGTIRVWDVESGECLGISPKIASVMTSVSFTVDGQRIVSGSWDGIVRIWDARLGIESKENTLRHNGSVWGVSISQDGLRVASASEDRTVRLWDAQTGEHVGIPLEGHTHPVLCVSFSPNGLQLVSGSRDKTLILWDTKTHSQIGDPFEGHKNLPMFPVCSVSFSIDGRRIISGCSRGTVRIWSLETHEQIGEALQGLSNSVVSVAESSEGCHVVSRDYFERIVIWNRDREVIWKSDDFMDTHAKVDATTIISRCGQQAPHLLTPAFPGFAPELYCEGNSVYSILLGYKYLLTDTLLDTRLCWTFLADGNVFAAGLLSGVVAICDLIVE